MIRLMNSDYTDKNSSLGSLYPDHFATVLARHDRALHEAGASHAVIYSGNPKIAFLDDYHHPFKANPHFVSWVPLTDLPYSCIVYTPGEIPILIYFQPHDYWHVVTANRMATGRRTSTFESSIPSKMSSATCLPGESIAF